MVAMVTRLMVIFVQCLDKCQAHEWGLPPYKAERAKLHIKIGHMRLAAHILKNIVQQLRDDGMDYLLCEAQVGFEAGPCLNKRSISHMQRKPAAQGCLCCDAKHCS